MSTAQTTLDWHEAEGLTRGDRLLVLIQLLMFLGTVVSLASIGVMWLTAAGTTS